MLARVVRAMLLIAVLLAAIASPAQGAILQVDSNANDPLASAQDCVDNDDLTPCTLRGAIETAAATTESDEIRVPADDYVITGALNPRGTGAVTIIGAGAATTTIDGNDSSSVFALDVSTTIQGVTIRDGLCACTGAGIAVFHGDFVLRDSVVESNEVSSGDGGGIAVDPVAASVRIERSIVRDNRATSQGGGIYSQGTVPLTVVDSTISGNRVGAPTGSPGGGGLYVLGPLTLTRVALADNTATSATGGESAGGGGAVVLGGLTMDDSSVTGNSAIGITGGIASGGGLYLSGGQPSTIRGSTIALNTVAGDDDLADGGGIRQFGASLTITNTTISGNRVIAGGTANNAIGGGAYFQTAATLTNVTLAGNTTAGNDPTAGNLQAPNATLRNTLIVDGLPANCGTPVAAAIKSLDTGTTCGLSAGNLNSVSNARIGPLTANGGRTATHALLTGSPAIDAGTGAGAPATDQRGLARAQGAGVDIGAFELVLALQPPQPTPPDRTAPAFLTKPKPARPTFRARRGTTVTYSLSENATVTFRVERRTTGRRVNGRCVKQKRSNRTRKRCVRYVLLTGRQTQTATAGPNSLRFVRRALPAGSYRLVATAQDAAGNRSAAARVAFRIVG
jgi:predicted outer membrane repeat protein